ncbi:unnamed protein product [Hydatigera taeniaeformis]|uniref:Uncharacterized protein n=1 Tax=Hydatigena taeniaeformis TaxID=6205 RepID=A0A0R3WUY5_HYDTA|nr:unnamed protein product [Hydatigera taeniaeformis]
MTESSIFIATDADLHDGDKSSRAHLVPLARVHMTSENSSSRARDVLRADVLENMKSNAEADTISAK